ncbi:hypothetical protein FSW04_23325 [Baekduia soli]|uniref:Carboxypeptidase regulatory-like domain-containing protein n=1 Tax=Baekduia soli TaxID=496014 RepID=A0A5B8UB53_9ACTN|nr:hypothetical protein [Baekduia soli]QEC50224.1 hypothetical protein FSW04_23325 [Baekduia soli]
MPLPRPLLRAGLLAALALATGATAAQADEHVAFLDGGGPVAAAGGTVAWSARGGDGRYRLVLATGGAPAAAAPGVAPAATPFDVALGHSGGRLVATYSRGRRAYVVPVAGGAERRIRAIPGPATHPAVDGDRLAWVVPGASSLKGCDRLEVRTGGGRARVISGACRKLAGVQVRGKDVVWSAIDYRGTDSHGAGGKSSTIWAFRFGGAVRTLDRTSFGEESNLLRSPSIDGRDVVYTQSGVHPRKSFARARLDGRGTPVRAAAGVALEGPMAVDGARAWYVIPGRGEESCDAGDQLAPVPCELVSAATAALAPGASRTLPPELSVAYTPAVQPAAGTPLTVAGALTRRTVRDGATVGSTPLPGEVVDVLARSEGSPETFTATGASATTGADGAYGVQVPYAALPFFTAQVRSSGLLAGRGTVGFCPTGTTPLPGGGCTAPR